MKPSSTLSAFLMILTGFFTYGNDTIQTSAEHKKKTVRACNVRFAARIHTMGQFAYGGRIVSDNPTVDINLTYDRRTWGLQLYKAQDLRDHNTQINFTLAVLNKSFHLGKRLTIAPSAGFILEQSNTIADHGSDVVLILNTTYRLSPTMTIDHASLVGNVALEPEERDWVNRLRLTWSRKHLDFSVTGWHNNKVFDTAEYVTLGAGAFYSRMKLAQGLMMNVGVSGLLMPYSSDENDYPKKQGVILSAVFVFQ